MAEFLAELIDFLVAAQSRSSHPLALVAADRLGDSRAITLRDGDEPGESASITIGDLAHFDDELTLADTDVVVTLYDGPAEFVAGRIQKESRTVRVLVRWSSVVGAVTMARALANWLQSERSIETASFVARILRFPFAPQATSVREDGTVIAEFAVIFLLMSRLTRR